MSLLDSISQWIDKERAQLAYVRIPADHVDKPSTNQALKAGVHYIRLRLASMFLKKTTRWFSRWYPVVYSTVELEFGDRFIQIPNIADESRLRMDQTPDGDVFAQNFVLTPLMPFHGGVVSLSAGLFALQGRNYRKSMLKTLGRFSRLLNVPQPSLAFNIALPLEEGIQEFFATTNAGVHLGLHDSFSEGQLRDGYFAAIRQPSETLDANKLFVVDNELHQGTTLQHTQPFQEADYMLFRVELLDKRDDWEGLRTIKEPFLDALNALGNKEQAEHFMRTALLRATHSPDLTAVDKRRVVDRLIERFEEAKRLVSFSAATARNLPILNTIMRYPMSVELCLEKGAPRESEVFAALSDNRSKAVRTPMPEIAPILPDPTTRSTTFFLGGLPSEDEKPSFYFATEGDGVRGNRVKFGAEFKLVFNYGTKDDYLVATLNGRELDGLLLADKAQLDIIIIPKGFMLIDGKWAQPATFIKGAIEKKVIFNLKADDEAVEDAVINVIFETKGAVLYEFFIPFQLTDRLDENGRNDFEPLNFDLDELAAARDRQQRTARLHIWANGDGLSITFDNLVTEQSFPVDPKIVTRSSLTDLLGKIKDNLEPVPNHIIWGVVDDPLARPANDRAAKAFTECLERVATAGWELYEGLNNDPEFAKVLAAVEKLEPGSTLTIKTNCAFLPWEILNPSPFNWKDPEEYKRERPVQPQNFWGNRFLIECLLAGEKQTYKTPTTIHESSPPFVSLNVFRTIDDGVVNQNFLPGKSHETLRAQLAPNVMADLRRDGKEIRKVFLEKNYAPTLIYLLCHGQNDKPFTSGQSETLEIDVKDFVAPNDVLVNNKYPCGPIMFLNSCSSGASSPLAFSTFLSKFREKNAVGLIGTSFPVPISFGSAFGQQLIRQYVQKHQPIGQALLDLRRQQLANGNPIGLFYTLQCPVDLTSHQK